MARYNCNTPRKNRRHHKKMKSGHKGKGIDRKIKAMKRLIAENSPRRSRPQRKKREKDDKMVTT